jgi:hypothetical protein
VMKLLCNLQWRNLSFSPAKFAVAGLCSRESGQCCWIWTSTVTRIIIQWSYAWPWGVCKRTPSSATSPALDSAKCAPEHGDYWFLASATTCYSEPLVCWKR